MTRDHDIKQLWRNQRTEKTRMSLAGIQTRAQRLNSRWRRSMMIEYVACAIVVAGFAYNAVVFPGWMLKVGSALVIVAAFFVAWQLRRRGPQPLPTQGVSIAAFHRAELVRVRDMFRTSWLWYIAPFVPGVALSVLGRVFQAHAPGRSLEMDYLVIALSAMIVALVLVLIAVFNLLRAYMVQRKIDEIDAWEAER